MFEIESLGFVSFADAYCAAYATKHTPVAPAAPSCWKICTTTRRDLCFPNHNPSPHISPEEKKKNSKTTIIDLSLPPLEYILVCFVLGFPVLAVFWFLVFLFWQITPRKKKIITKTKSGVSEGNKLSQTQHHESRTRNQRRVCRRHNLHPFVAWSS